MAFVMIDVLNVGSLSAAFCQDIPKKLNSINFGCMN
jgi:hypothetical protein